MVASWLNPLLASASIPYRSQFVSWLLHYPSSFLPVTWGRTKDGPKPFWPFGDEPADGRYFSLSLLASIDLPFNKNE